MRTGFIVLGSGPTAICGPRMLFDGFETLRTQAASHDANTSKSPPAEVHKA
jgi:hypothetical protein